MRQKHVAHDRRQGNNDGEAFPKKEPCRVLDHLVWNKLGIAIPRNLMELCLDIHAQNMYICAADRCLATLFHASKLLVLRTDRVAQSEI